MKPLRWDKCWWCNGWLGKAWRKDPSVKFCEACGERTIDPRVLRDEAAADRRKSRQN